MTSILQEAKKHLLAVQNSQKSYIDTKTREFSSDVGIQILISVSNITLNIIGAKRLLLGWIEPFNIMQRVGNVAYKLELVDTWKIHRISHVHF